MAVELGDPAQHQPTVQCALLLIFFVALTKLLRFSACIRLLVAAHVYLTGTDFQTPF